MISLHVGGQSRKTKAGFVKVEDRWRRCHGIYGKAGDQWHCVLDNKVARLPLLRTYLGVHDVRISATRG
jgi:hypothetical protein